MGPEAHGRKRRHFGPYPEPSMAAPSEATVRSIPRRSTSESLLIQNGESLSNVKEQLGHSSVKITVDVYARLVPGSYRQAVNRLLPLYGFRAAGQNRMHWSVLTVFPLSSSWPAGVSQAGQLHGRRLQDR